MKAAATSVDTPCALKASSSEFGSGPVQVSVYFGSGCICVWPHRLKSKFYYSTERKRLSTMTNKNLSNVSRHYYKNIFVVLFFRKSLVKKLILYIINPHYVVG